MNTGTKSVLWGYHAFWLHGFFTLRAWCVVYGWPSKWWEWIAIFIHDIGYLGLPNMDGPEGKDHPLRSGRLIKWLGCPQLYEEIVRHSRYTSRTLGVKPSRLCTADKLAFTYYPKWLLGILYVLSGEGHEYLYNFRHGILQTWIPYTGGIDHWSLWFAWANEDAMKYLKGTDKWKMLPTRRRKIIKRRSSLTNFASQ